MRKYRWHMLIGLSLVLASAIVYELQILVFHRTTDTFFYMLQDLAFVPVQILVVTLIVNELLKRRETNLLKHKLNMVIGSFFSEMGNQLLSHLLPSDQRCEELRSLLNISPQWTARTFQSASRELRKHGSEIDLRPELLEELRSMLNGQRYFLLNMLANPNLLEHETFTDLLWAICHLTQELEHRQSLSCLEEDDSSHLAGDISRVYARLLEEWLSWVEHLNREYPYMYSLIVRANPVNAEDPAWAGCRLPGT